MFLDLNTDSHLWSLHFIEWISFSLWCAMSTFSATAWTEAIPIYFQAQILPTSLLSIAEFLKFPLPLHAMWKVESMSFGSNQFSTADISFKILVCLPIPPMTTITQLVHLPYARTWNSVVYPYLGPDHSSANKYFPLWIISYWNEVLQLQKHAPQPLLQFFSWLISIQAYIAFCSIPQSCTASRSWYSVSWTLFLLIHLYHLTYAFSYWTIWLPLTHYLWLINTYINHSYMAVFFKLDLDNHT